MKPFIAPFILLFFCFQSYSQLPSQYRRTDSDKIFNYEFYITDYKPKKLREGTRYFWFKSGKINSSFYGYSGKLLNEKYTKTLLDSKRLIEQGFFKRGLKKGVWITWYNNGKVKEESTFLHGRKNGLYKLYDQKGTLITKGNYKNDERFGKWYFWDLNSGRLKIETWKGEKINGLYKEYDEKGKLLVKGVYKRGIKHGKWVWIKDEKEKITKHYKEGKEFVKEKKKESVKKKAKKRKKSKKKKKKK